MASQTHVQTNPTTTGTGTGIGNGTGSGTGANPELRHPRFKAWAAALAFGACSAAQAQFSMVPAPLCPPPRESTQEVEQEYRIDAARHMYACYPMRVFRGKLPPLLYGIAIVEIELDPQGNVLAAEIIRKPAADEVAPWILAMIRRAAPYPAPTRFPEGKLRFKETFFVDKSGLFQAFTLTEGQR